MGKGIRFLREIRMKRKIITLMLTFTVGTPVFAPNTAKNSKTTLYAAFIQCLLCTGCLYALNTIRIVQATEE